MLRVPVFLHCAVFVTVLAFGENQTSSPPPPPPSPLQLPASRTPTVIDTDAGADDALAIGMFLNDPNTELVAITCTYGNTDVQHVVTNVLETLTVFADDKNTSVKVYTGSERPLLYTKRTPYLNTMHYGADGFGDNDPAQRRALKSSSSSSSPLFSIEPGIRAPEALVDLSKVYAGRLRIIVLGPTTNLATALITDPTTARRLHRVYIMGGSVSGVGNTAPGVEFNFVADPESNRIVLDAEYNQPVVLVPWDTNALNGVPVQWRQSWADDDANAAGSDRLKFINRIERVSATKNRIYWRSADTLTAAVAIEPATVLKTQRTCAVATLCADYRGGVVLDHANVTERRPNADVVREIDLNVYKNIVLNALKLKSK